MPLRFILAFLTLIAVSGCNLDTADYPQTEPFSQDIAGVYTPTATTLQDIQNRGHYQTNDITITLGADGTFTCKNIPDSWMAGSGKSSGAFITKTGTWKPVKEQQWWSIGLDFSTSSQFTVENTTIKLLGAKPPFALRMILGDPDEGQAMDFMKHK